VLLVRKAFWIELHDGVFDFAVQNGFRDNGAVPRTLRSVFDQTFIFRTLLRSHDPDEQRGAMRQRPRSIAPLENSEEIRDGAAFLAKLTARNS
jgi:hypothetical protein